MDVKASAPPGWLWLDHHQWHHLRHQEHAGPILTAVAVVLLTYVLYTVSIRIIISCLYLSK